ncbi:BolA family protein [Alcanivorax quisquiliarum]|uniref:BolA/IbaG family iron-sulfur metabolism protein n=1 Tax=Alcanivorax quisquiliarum TaxID=2933565 RepID=A0ABT0E371_9GAMM|nr:BolA/IbaG family iron-sulfur metabolism protein [Alcanivorax quisquiliarum]MCK0536265.1 BolA/IbaG family iron-sulfur metabolism protein [Alcanivorax quisquiliarum]
MSSVAELIERKVREALPVAHLELENESHQHSGPATDSHFKLVLVSDAFSGLRLVQRHQKIYALVAEELAGPVHALALHTFTPEEWQARGAEAADSPNCRGGSQSS